MSPSAAHEALLPLVTRFKQYYGFWVREMRVGLTPILPIKLGAADTALRTQELVLVAAQLSRGTLFPRRYGNGNIKLLGDGVAHACRIQQLLDVCCAAQAEHGGAAAATRALPMGVARWLTAELEQTATALEAEWVKSRRHFIVSEGVAACCGRG